MSLLMDVGADGVAVITISNPPVNSLATTIIAGLKEKYDEAIRRDDVKAIVLVGEGGKFSGGFDINVMKRVQKTGDKSILPDVSVALLNDTVEAARKPSVAAIQGLALGGGLELAMACNARISTPKAQLGLPELTLGVIPGFGGTQRLPRLVGLSKAIEMMLLSKPITSDEGRKLGLIDEIVPADELLRVSRKWALDIAERRKPWLISLHLTDKLGSLSEARDTLKIARQQAARIAPNMPQHQVCLDAIEEGIVSGGYAGVVKEAKIFKESVVSDTAKGLIHAFFAQRTTSKITGVTDIGLRPRPIKKVAVIGGGLMGSGIATALILSNTCVILKEANSNYLQQGIDRISANLKGLVAKGTISNDKFDKTMSLVKGALDYSEFSTVDMVIEAVIENVSLKQSLFNTFEKECPPHCILATNTSTIDLNLVGARTNSHDRIVGAHFFSPAHVMPLLEIVRSEKTSPQVILDLMTIGTAIKKVPVVVGNCTGFAVNRNFFPYTQSAHLLVHLGVDLFRVDRVISSFGMPMGPFQLQDLAGYDLAVAVSKEFASAFVGRTFTSPLVSIMMEKGRSGKKNGKGYYLYEKGSKPKADPNVLPIIEESRRQVNILPGGKPIMVSDREILEMIFFPVVNEACRVLSEGIVVRASDLDISSVLGMGFPKYRGGIVFWADSVGPTHIYSSLKKWAKAYGAFYEPCLFLEERAKKGIPLSDLVASSGGAMARL
ncbi:peroxisomal fatty acid beta-oxidation multifunctional protein [Amborella trichopoda]|uniref:Uncharacterized protein n=1 Tax=Amborella trichopoda TaxID=13333 RepID=W1NSF6_AMBTC|nr:peroxisomal fatty acid beta-oxidation multifunctional protein [Amborella trichopoda]ERM98618.1 hypothetical protein AMTR_s00109p00083880 [Amborella trichopoda]|eukprot:XP_006833340.1 peroxisomal fatty acid beta-oxidation multifunctional protein [Amborella trichopoda]